ncbi:DoxX family protein [Mesorhizobium sp. B2-3-5]|uniref:DoxX family protein n=1 Tax=Mesorhizobium sp. B2-3-5 TaxID=2589958 RepID=UPI00112B0503|nr:DoxX family protein [Mesorhizobium sp. B2-3-5]TPM22515.1 DoxX family protein [Mesorhizobium sp. B2-3-5]
MNARRLFSCVSLRLLRILVSSPFWISGLSKLGDWNSAISEMTYFHLSPPAPYAAATILVQILGSAMLIVGPCKWLGAIALSGFAALTIPVAHDFWNQVGADRAISLDFAIEHMAVIGGLLAVARLAAESRSPGGQ